MDAMGPVVAGSFYPADPEALSEDVGRMLDAAPDQPIPGLRAVIVPHAGYVYSGPVAATGYAQLVDLRFRRVVLIGPSHFVRFDGIAVPEAGGWAVPVAEFPIDDAGLPRRQEPFATEHCLEVQLPFLHAALGAVPIVPILTGEVAATEVAGVIDGTLGDDDLLVVSTDLSHYHPYAMARKLDAVTADAVVAGDWQALGWDSACGRTGLQAAMLLADERGWSTTLLDLRNSGDTAGDRSRVVGYGAFTMNGEAA